MPLVQTKKSVARSTTPWKKAVFSRDDFWDRSEGLHYAYLVNRTLRGDYAHTFQPDSVFYVGKYPAAYLKMVDAFREADTKRWQRFLWNQAVVPMLIIQTQTSIQIYTANTKPLQPTNESEKIKAILEITVDALESIKTKIEEGSFYEDYKKAFLRTTTVDQHLLKNLNATAKKLAKTLDGGIPKSNLKFVHRFLTRILFVCYLIERGMVKGKSFPESSLVKLQASSSAKKPYLLRHLLNDLSTVEERIAAIDQLFRYVKDRFNGSLFPDSISQEIKRYKKPFLDVLVNFLNGHNVESGQMSLGFWAYDFSVIPIETISSIYEEFLKTQGELDEKLEANNSQHNTGAYYTPPHLAELTADIALGGVEKPIHKLKVFDPSCGSGVFLVTMLGRMADSLRRKQWDKEKCANEKWGSKVMALLHQIYGLDINSTACHISCFSLYLAALEQMTPLDLETLHQMGKKFPPLLLDEESGQTDGNNIVCANFFDENIPLKENRFDLIIGNPPWVSRKRFPDIKFLEWRSSKGKKKENIRAPKKQMAAGFMWETQSYLLDSGRACLLLPAGIFLNKNTNHFQEKWLKSVVLKRLVNFSDLCRVLFKKANHPCIAACFSRSHGELNNYTFSYESPKVDPRSKTGGPVYIREEDVTQLCLNKILEAAKEGCAPTLWKIKFWGSWRDQRLLARLDTFPKVNELTRRPRQKNKICEALKFPIPAASRRGITGIFPSGRTFAQITDAASSGALNPRLRNKCWIIKRGCESYSENDRGEGKKIHRPWWDENYKFLPPGKQINFVVGPSSFVEVPEKFRELRCDPDRQIFDRPKIIISKGSRDMKVAFCHDPVIFSDSFGSISAPNEDADILRFLSVVIKSDLAQYYLFHTSASWGIERSQIFLQELRAIPFFLPEFSSDPNKAREIIKKVVKRVKDIECELAKGKWFGLEDEGKSIRQELEPLIRQYYEITPAEDMLIDDTLRTIIPSSTPTVGKKILTLRPIKNQDCVSYGKTLCSTLTLISREKTGQFSARVFFGHPYSVVQIYSGKTSKKIEIINDSSQMNKVMKRLQKALDKKQGNVTFCQNLKIFDEDTLYILKPNQYRFWMKSAALNDADQIAGSILLAKEGLIP